MKQQPDVRSRSRRSVVPDYTRLPDDDRPDLDELFLSVDVGSTAPPGTEATEAAWVVRYG